jgi:hypothetical protein
MNNTITSSPMAGSVIKTPNHLIFNDVHIFTTYIMEIMSFVKKFVVDFPIMYAYEQLMTLYQQSIQHCVDPLEQMTQYNTLVRQLSDPFLTIHSVFLRNYLVEKHRQFQFNQQLMKTLEENEMTTLISGVTGIDLNADMDFYKTKETEIFASAVNAITQGENDSVFAQQISMSTPEQFPVDTGSVFSQQISMSTPEQFPVDTGSVFAQQISMSTPEQFPVDTGSVFAQHINMPVQTSFYVDTEETPLQHITSKPNNDENHYVVDGLNLFSRMSEPLTLSLKDLGYMDTERKVEFHQFNCVTEQKRVLDYVIEFFDKAAPPGSLIHFVFKQFGTDESWEQFKEYFANTFMNAENNLAHTYDFYVAKPAFYGDKECDDRLVARLAIKLEKDKRNYVYVVSNDNYNSMPQHWAMSSKYEYHGDSPIKDGLGNPAVGDLYKLSQLKYDFSVEKSIHSDTAEFVMNFREINYVY